MFQTSMSRGGADRVADRSPYRSAYANSAEARPQPRAGDLAMFGKTNKPRANAPMTFGASSVFNKKDMTKRESASLSRASNAFSLLSQGSDAAANPPAPTASAMNSRAPSRKASVDLGPGGAPEILGQRRKVNLLPRSKPAEDGSRPASPDAVAFPSTEDKETEEPEEAGMSETEAKKKIDEDIKEFFAVRNIDEAEDYFVKLPSQHRHLLVDKLVTRAIESKQSDAQLVSDLFERAHSKDLCTPDAFEQGFLPVAEMLDDIAIDAPKAFDLMAIMLKGSGIAADKARRARIANNTMNADKLVALLLQSVVDDLVPKRRTPVQVSY
jgi:translation initiation factor 4G